jgi:hypothetical protein
MMAQRPIVIGGARRSTGPKTMVIGHKPAIPGYAGIVRAVPRACCRRYVSGPQTFFQKKAGISPAQAGRGLQRIRSAERRMRCFGNSTEKILNL